MQVVDFPAQDEMGQSRMLAVDQDQLIVALQHQNTLLRRKNEALCQANAQFQRRCAALSGVVDHQDNIIGTKDAKIALLNSQLKELEFQHELVLANGQVRSAASEQAGPVATQSPLSTAPSAEPQLSEPEMTIRETVSSGSTSLVRPSSWEGFFSPEPELSVAATSNPFAKLTPEQREAIRRRLLTHRGRTEAVCHGETTSVSPHDPCSVRQVEGPTVEHAFDAKRGQELAASNDLPPDSHPPRLSPNNVGTTPGDYFAFAPKRREGACADDSETDDDCVGNETEDEVAGTMQHNSNSTKPQEQRFATDDSETEAEWEGDSTFGMEHGFVRPDPNNVDVGLLTSPADTTEDDSERKHNEGPDTRSTCDEFVGVRSMPASDKSPVARETAQCGVEAHAVKIEAGATDTSGGRSIAIEPTGDGRDDAQSTPAHEVVADKNTNGAETGLENKTIHKDESSSAPSTIASAPSTTMENSPSDPRPQRYSHRLFSAGTQHSCCAELHGSERKHEGGTGRCGGEGEERPDRCAQRKQRGTDETESMTQTPVSDQSLPDSVRESIGRGEETDQEEGPPTESSADDRTIGCSRDAARDRYTHTTFCSLCVKARPEREAVALCEGCPRIVCRWCSDSLGVKISKTRGAYDVILPAAKCRCLRCDSKFPKPLKGVRPEVHLLEHLRKHDLSVQFRAPVDIVANPNYLGAITRDEMMDLSTMGKKMRMNQYGTSRGRRMFRRDVQQIWLNCWKYAGYDPHSDAIVPGIVSCALILAAMVDGFFRAHMQEMILAVDHTSWLSLEMRAKRGKFDRMSKGRLKGRPRYVVNNSPAVVGLKKLNDSDEEFELNEHNVVGIRTTSEGAAGKKRKKSGTSARSGQEGLVSGLCSMADIGERLGWKGPASK